MIRFQKYKKEQNIKNVCKKHLSCNIKSLRQFSFLTNFVQKIQFTKFVQTIQFFNWSHQSGKYIRKYICYFSATAVIKIILFFNWVLINQFSFVQSRKYFYQFSGINISSDFFLVDVFKCIFYFCSLICVFVLLLGCVFMLLVLFGAFCAFWCLLFFLCFLCV